MGFLVATDIGISMPQLYFKAGKVESLFKRYFLAKRSAKLFFSIATQLSVIYFFLHPV